MGSLAANRPSVALQIGIGGMPRGSAPPTPPDVRVRIRRFGELSYRFTVKRGIPSESK